MTIHQLASSCHTGREEASDSIGVFSTPAIPKRLSFQLLQYPRRKDSVIHAQLTHVIPHISNLGLLFQDQGNVGFSLPEMWARMGIPAKAVVIILFIMSIWSLAVIIDRAIYFNAARKQSREFAPKVAGALREGKLDEAVKVADRNKKSHLAEVVTAGLQEFRSYGNGGAITEDQIESSKRALERAEAIVHAKLKRGLGGLATIGSTAPFIGLFGTVVGILNAFQQIATQKSAGIGAIAGGISEALVTTAFGLLVAIPAVMLFNYFTNKVEAFDVEMDNSSSELVDYFIKQSQRR
jgi:biopolymer transport protein ExbB/biopolymer transport protein TolQ